MHQKDAVRRAWVDAGLYASDDPKIQAFLKHFEEATGDCWSELANELRERYPEHKEQLVMPIWLTGDKLLRLNVIRAIEIEREDEEVLLRKLLERTDAQQGVHELRAIMQKEHLPLMDQIVRMQGLDPGFKDQLLIHRARVKAQAPDK